MNIRIDIYFVVCLFVRAFETHRLIICTAKRSYIHRSIEKQTDLSIFNKDKFISAIFKFYFSAIDLFVEVK